MRPARLVRRVALQADVIRVSRLEQCGTVTLERRLSAPGCLGQRSGNAGSGHQRAQGSPSSNSVSPVLAGGPTRG